MAVENYDFGGWVTRNDIKCSDGRTIRHNAFADNDGTIVPLVWNHVHDSADNVLGQVYLENRDSGVYGYGKLNNTHAGETAKELIKHGDITALSIHANNLKQNKGDVLHGKIREVSLVLAGANPGAYIDSVLLHGELSDEEAIIYSGEDIDKPNGCTLMHSDTPDYKKDDEDDAKKKEKEQPMSNEPTNEQTNETNKNGGPTIKDVFETLNEDQKKAVYVIIGTALEDQKKELAGNADKQSGEEDNEDMKHNVFEGTSNQVDVLTHSDQADILDMARSRSIGSFKEALKTFQEENNVELMHGDTADTVGGFYETGTGNVTELFPEYKDVRPGAPEVIDYNQDWVKMVLSKAHKSPLSRVRTRQVDIRGIQDLKGKGYKKGAKKKLSGNFKLVSRTTDPQTVYTRNSLNRDDIIDITDFDYVDYLYQIDKSQLDETLATAIMIGDGRDDGDADKIFPEHIRPIWTDDDLYTIHADLDFDATKSELQGTDTKANFGENFIKAETMVNTILYARENYRGSGTPDLFVTPHMLNVMLLARDMNGRRIYSSKAELASSLNVGNIVTAEQFEGKTRTTEDGATKELVGLVVNLADYTVGSTKGGEVTHFTQFDIDFNQQKSLLETRCSGALTRVYSAIALEIPQASKTASGSSSSTGTGAQG